MKIGIAVVWACFLSPERGQAEDRIELNKDNPVVGEIISFKNDLITVKTARGVYPVAMAGVKSVAMDPRPELEQAVQAMDKEDFARVVELLAPVRENFLGLPVPWVAEAAGYLADALAAQGKTFESEALGKEILRLYPDSVFRFKGVLAQVRTALAEKKNDEALRLLEEVRAAIPPEAVPDAQKMQILGDMHLLLAEMALQKGDKQQALEHYLLVHTVYHKPERRAERALAEADKIRQADAGMHVR
ncbi:MAG: site-specific recombinase [Bdellovibrionaceae bacterium]|nr:site-specific recombinase [Pseudobdellovibrionaceae bacterium]